MNTIYKELLVQDVAKYVYALVHDSHYVDGLPLGFYRDSIGRVHGFDVIARIVHAYLLSDWVPDSWEA